MNNMMDLLKVADSLTSRSWADAYTQSFIPADGTVIVQREWVEKKYMVKYEEDGTIKYIPIKEEKVEE